MAAVSLFIAPAPAGSPFRVIDRTFKFTRVPSVGEFIALGNDKNGIAADYEVMLVHHAPLRPKRIDAAVYAQRVFLPKRIKAAAARPKETNELWGALKWTRRSRSKTRPKTRPPLH